MKTSRIGRIGLAMALSAGLGYAASAAFAETGSRLGLTSSPQTTIWTGSPSEIIEIRKLLQKGKTVKAIKAARAFLSRMRNNATHQGTLYQYFARNALCAALSADGQLDQAVTQCDAAISLRPDRWEAINARGTVHYLAGRYQKAAEDYRRALALKHDTGDVNFILRHNLKLAEGKLAGS